VGLLAGLFFLLFSAPLARADRNPPGCLGSGLGISLFTSLPDVHIGDTISYTVNVFNSPFPACNAGETNPAVAGAIKAFVVTPDGVTNNITLRRTFLAPGDSDFYTNVVSYVVRAQDIRSDGTVRTTAVDQGDIHQNDVNSSGGGNQGVNTQVNQPCVLIAAQCFGSVGENGAITFTGTVTNCGNNTLVGLTVTNFHDRGFVTVLFPTNLAIGQVAAFSGSWVPLNACLPSTATLTVRATDEFTSTPRTLTSFATITCQNTLTPGIKVTKACPAQPVAPGQLLTFSGSVSNTGNVTLTNIVVVDNQPAANTAVFTKASLAPGEVANFTGSYNAPADCSVADTLTANASSLCGVAVTSVASATCPIITAPAVAVTLSCPVGPVVSGGPVTYTGTVRNSGNVILDNVTVNDQSTAPTSGLMGYWAFNEASGSVATDSSGSGNNGNIINATRVPGKSGNGLSFDGTSAYVDIANSPSVNFAGTMTMAAWIQPRSSAGIQNIFAHGQTTSPTNGVFLRIVDGQYQALAWNGTSAPWLSVAMPAGDVGTWVHLAATFDGSTWTLYRNGVAIGSNSAGLAPMTLNANWGIGARGGGGEHFFNGLIDEVRLYNRALSGAEIGSLEGSSLLFSAANLAVGASANFTLGQAATESCSVTANVIATARDHCTSLPVTNTASATCPVQTTPALVVTLACPAVPGAPGAVITYTGTVRNSGDVTLNNVTVVNDEAVPRTVLTVASLAPGASTNFTSSATAPVDACSVHNAVTARGSDNCTAVQVSSTTSATCTLITAPRILVTQNCPVNPPNLGGVLTYSGNVMNAGNITLTNVVVTNDRSGATPVFTLATLAPGASADFTGSYTVAGNSGCSITSTLTANAHDKCTGTTVSANAAATCAVQGAANIAVTLACPVTPTPLGGVLTFSGNVRNAGNITVTNVVVRQDAPAPGAVIFSVASLAPGASANFTGSYTVPSLNACSVTTSVSASAKDQCAGLGVIAGATIDCPLVAAPRIVVTQTCPVTSATPGGLIVYSGSVNNAGNITLTNITVVSSQPAPNTVVFTLGSLAPGASASFTSSFNAPLDTCSATSTLTASGHNQCSGVAVNNSVTTTCPLMTAPQITVTKTCPATPVTEGGLLVFTGTVTNTGNITLTNVVVLNDHPSANTRVLGPITLAPGAGTNFTGSYTAPLNACSVTDTLLATGLDKCSGVVSSNSTTTICPVTTIPHIAVTLACPAVPVATGGVITYTGTVRNSGNVTLNNVSVVNSQSVPNTVLTVPSLLPGVSANFTVSFTAPADACSVSSLVTANGSDACTSVQVSATASATCPLVTAPRIAVTQNCPAQPVSPNGLLTYSGTVMNTGNITLSNVVVTSDRSGAAPVFTAARLAPGASADFTGSYTVPANSGCSINSTVTANAGDTCTGARVTASASATCPILTAPAIEVTQKCPATAVLPGGILTYSGTVTNSGNITLTNIVVIDDRPASNTVIFTVAVLLPGATTNFSGSYQVPLNCCVSSSTVGVRGQDICTGATVADTFTATCPVLTVPAIVVTKVCPPTPVRTGDTLYYSGTVSNAGNITLVGVTIVNTQPDAGSPVLGPIALAPGESVSYYASYLVRPDFCGLDTVTAQGLDLCTFAPVVNSMTTTCPILTTARIAVTQNCPAQPTPRGGVYTFTGTVSNPGDVTLVDVYVANNYQVDCFSRTNGPVIGPITLAPGASVNFSGSYLAPGSCCEVVDTLTASGHNRCAGTLVTATSTAVCPLLSTPGISITRVCPGSPVPVGGVFAYTGSVSNTGDVVLTNVFVISSQTNGNTRLLGPIELAPGESEEFSGSYIVTAGSNPAIDTVTAQGTDTCQGRTVSARANCAGPVPLVQLVVASVTTSNGTATVAWTATPGTTYRLQWKDSLQGSTWNDIPGDIIATGTNASKTDVMDQTKQRFYRIMIVPK